MGQIELSKNQLHIMQIIEKHPGIYHRKLLNIVNAKKIMAKPTAEKNIKELLENRKIFAHKYRNQKQYMLSSLESSDKDVNKQIELLIRKIQSEIFKLEKNLPKYEYYTKVSLADYLHQKLDSFSKLMPAIEHETKRSEMTNMDEEVEILDSIRDIVEKHNIDFMDPRYIHLGDARKICTNISKLQHNLLAKDKERIKKRASKKRNELSKEINQMFDDLEKLRQKLNENLEQLKSKVK